MNIKRLERVTVIGVLLLCIVATAFVSCAAAADSAAFVKDVTYPDRAVVNAGTTFTKTWSFKNTGTVTWQGYTLCLSSYNNKNFYPTSVPIPTTSPGQTVSISVKLTAPTPTPTSPVYAVQESTWAIKNKAGAKVSGGTATLKITINPPSGTNIPNLANSAYQASVNPYATRGYGGQCTAFAWGRAKEKTGISTVSSGDAYTWYPAIASTTKGTIPIADSIAVWKKGTTTSTSHGHVAYVESISSSNIIINEANFNSYNSYVKYAPLSSWGGGYDGAPKTLTKTNIGSHVSSGLAGYIYLKDKPLSISPSSGPRGTTFKFSGKGYTPNGNVEWHVRKPTGEEYPVSTLKASTSGFITYTYTSTSSSATGTYTIWAVDVTTKQQSNTVEEKIT